MVLQKVDAEGAVAILDEVLPSALEKGTRRYHTPAEMTVMGLKAWELAAKGMSSRKIGEELGLNHTSVLNYKRHVMNTIAYPLVDDVRKQMMDQIEELIDAFMPKALAGDYKAADIVLKAQERWAKITGADKPVQVDATVTEVSAEDRELQAMLAAVQASESVIEGEVLPDAANPAHASLVAPGPTAEALPDISMVSGQ